MSKPTTKIPVMPSIQKRDIILEENKHDTDLGGTPIAYARISRHQNHALGRLLTLVDAIILPGEQNKAAKDMVKNIMYDLDREISTDCYLPY